MFVSCSLGECLNLGENKLLSVNVVLELLDTAVVGKVTSGFIYQLAPTAQRWALEFSLNGEYITACLQHKSKQ